MSRATKPLPNSKPTTPATKSAPLTWKEKLLPEEYEQLRNVFDMFDEDHSGLIDPEEINKIMDELGESRMGSFTYGLIEGLKSKGKPINFDEFLELVCPKVGEVRTKEGLRTIFNHLDKQGDDLLDF
jgi:calmodulin